MKITVPSIQFGASYLVISSFIFLLLTASSLGQTQAPSVTSGVTFQWDETQTVPTDPATLSSITINGEVFQSIAAPSSYVLTRLGPNGHSPNKVIRNGTIINNSSATVNWSVDALAAFQDKNLNHYFQANPNGRDICNDFSAVSTTDAQLQSLYYNPGIPSNQGGIIAITERNANNCYYIGVYGTPVGGGPEQFLGDTFVRSYSTNQNGPLFNAPPAGVDYWNSGRVVENNGTIGIAIFLLEDLAPVGSVITRVDLLASTADHGDGKFFILQRYAVPKTERSCMNEAFNGTVDGINIPNGSTFSLVSGPTPAGQSFTFNSDGSYSYDPSIGFTGDVTFDYSVCLPAPNTGTCDTATVTITYESGPGTGCECSSGNADAPLLQN
ncbi:Ig-like domain-containing protein [Altibacter sp.]|uniref:Ig-like domain-containing protein n=1 Tax=Altibacter sp. TaxID=2024823 RepID=UPI0025C0212A|nr:Ig-like domain-containing protein [Altibacter sp.]